MTPMSGHAARLTAVDSALRRDAGRRLLLCVRVTVTRRRLDRDLAGNPTPPWNDARRLRARQLLTSRVRCELARALAGMLELAEERGHAQSRPAADALAARPALESLGERLGGPRPVSVRGMARVAALVDRYGGLNPDHPSSQLSADARAALRAME